MSLFGGNKKEFTQTTEAAAQAANAVSGNGFSAFSALAGGAGGIFRGARKLLSFGVKLGVVVVAADIGYEVYKKIKENVVEDEVHTNELPEGSTTTPDASGTTTPDANASAGTPDASSTATGDGKAPAAPDASASDTKAPSTNLAAAFENTTYTPSAAETEQPAAPTRDISSLELPVDSGASDGAEMGPDV